MKCKWCNADLPGIILIEEVCLACIVEDSVDENFVIEDEEE